MTDHYAPAPGFHERPLELRFGPSILDKAEQCPRAYALTYLCGYDRQELAWADIAEHTYDTDRRCYVAPAGYVGDWPTVPSRKRSTALGTECHARVEAHYEGRPEVPGHPRWLDLPGQIAQAWLDVMPKPHECDEVWTELPVRLWPAGAGYGDDELTLEGTSDLLLLVREASGYLVGDWKTTRSWQYQKTAADLYTNRQGVIYPLAAMRRLSLDAIPGRWAYSITDVKKRREARATDFTQTREHAEARVAEYFAEARALRDIGLRFLALTDGGGAGDLAQQRLDFVQSEYAANVSACDDYGGCPHSYERGGACTAKRTTGARIMALGSAGNKPTCAPSVIPLESLLRKSVERNQETGMTQQKPSPWAAKAAQFRARTAAPEAPPPVDPATGLFAAAGAAAEARASVALDGETWSAEAGGSTGLDPQPEVPSPVAPRIANHRRGIVFYDPQPEVPSPVVPEVAEPPMPKGRRGRPPGSKNRTPAKHQSGADLPAALRVQSGALADEGVTEDGEDFQVAPPAARMPTLPEIAAAAQSLGCDITIYFPARAS